MADDFRYLFPGVKNELHFKWEAFTSNIMNVYEDITDIESIKILNILKKTNLSPGKD